MPRTKSDSIHTMGLEHFLNASYGHLEPKFGMKPYDRFVLLVTAGQGDTFIAREFSTEHRELKYQSVRNWRAWYLAEQEQQ
jgi:hypothetical protein